MELNWKLYVQRYLEALYFASGIAPQDKFGWITPSMRVDISPAWRKDRIKRLQLITPTRISTHGPQSAEGLIWYWKNEYGDYIDEAHQGGMSHKPRCGMVEDKKVLNRILQVRDSRAEMSPGLIEIVSPLSMPWVSREQTLRMMRRIEGILEVAE